MERVAGISVVVPAYRSPGTLRQLCSEVDEHVGPLVDEYEIILVDDGSNDGTWREISDIANEDPRVRGLTLLRNYGQHNALLAGLRSARLPLIATIDDDLQNPPSEIPHLLAALGPDVDLVYGRPRKQPQGATRNFASRVAKKVMSGALGPEMYQRSSAFRVFRRSLVAASEDVRDSNISIDVLLSWATNRVTDVPVDFDERREGKSGYTVRRLVKHATNMITGYSTRPLRWVSLLGMATASFGFILLVFVLARYIFGGADVAGFTFLAAAITLFSGVQLLSLGVLGEYVGRMHFRSMGKPPYVVREVVGFDDVQSHDDGDPTRTSLP